MQVLGTFITAWGEGRRTCERMLSSLSLCNQVGEGGESPLGSDYADPYPYEPANFSDFSCTHQAADQLAAIAAYHGFEGWLINIENTLPKDLIPALVHFVGYLRGAMRRAVGQHASVVW